MISHGIVASAFTYQNSDQDLFPAVVQLQNESVLNDQDHNMASRRKPAVDLGMKEVCNPLLQRQRLKYSQLTTTTRSLTPVRTYTENA